MPRSQRLSTTVPVSLAVQNQGFEALVGNLDQNEIGVVHPGRPGHNQRIHHGQGTARVTATQGFLRIDALCEESAMSVAINESARRLRITIDPVTASNQDLNVGATADFASHVQSELLRPAALPWIGW
jgi:hypothetical protein